MARVTERTLLIAYTRSEPETYFMREIEEPEDEWRHGLEALLVRDDSFLPKAQHQTTVPPRKAFGLHKRSHHLKDNAFIRETICKQVVYHGK